MTFPSLSTLSYGGISPSTAGKASVLSSCEKYFIPGMWSKIPAAWLTPIAAMKGHLEHLCSDVLANTPADRLIDLDRYLQAIEMRLEKLQSRLLLDAQWQKEVDEIESGLKALWSTYPEDWQYQDPKLVDLRWQIEEFQVLCFAQSLKTRDKVSFKRLSTALRDYREL